MKAKILSKKIIATGTIYLEFKTEQPIIFSAGQFLEWTISNPQYQDEKGNSRYFTIAYPPNETGTIALATRLSDSAFKQSLNNLPIGAELEISAPSGSFLLSDPGAEIIMLAGGIGITPFISQLMFIKNSGLNYKIKLLYFNRNQESTAWLNEIKTLTQELTSFEFVPVMSDDPTWGGEQGIITAEIIKKYSEGMLSPLYLVVGPPKMVEATNAILKTLNVPQNKIKLEAFAGY